ncbi:hypothetical protein PAXRUDRAFT_22705 [Paxillus rubicundulus Ve08.2h10]|uniref:Uncharacterized protein n=1 Tax=Paxillus rubicundulus Ve08.2h10 TaxID=930991 RepID=A0A0D0CMR3_9AGAM|nr:hypothetical protein PAXRUDRAFT_22705 [Paxillus rubicundulus Ve08.2h10]
MSVNPDVDDENDWLDEPRQLDPEAVGAERCMFTNTNMAQTHVHDTAGISTTDPRGSTAAAMPPPADTEWESWE